MYTIYKTQKDHIVNPKKVTDFCWIDINSVTEEELAELREIVDIPEDVVVSIRDIDEVPKVERLDDFQFILIQTPLMFVEENGDMDNPETHFSITPLGIIYSPHLIVTISEGKNDIIDYLKGKLKNYAKNNIIHTDNIPQFILKLLLFTAKMYLRYFKVINHKIRTAQSNLEQTPQNEEIIRLMNLEKSLVYFSTSLHSNMVVFEKIAKREFFTGNDEDKELAEDILDENKQALETGKIYGKIVVNVSNTFASIISNNLNQTVKFLTSVTIIIMLPTLVASIYGMNVELPFQHSPFAFFITIAISILLSVLGVFLFFRNKLF